MEILCFADVARALGKELATEARARVGHSHLRPQIEATLG